MACFVYVPGYDFTLINMGKVKFKSEKDLYSIKIKWYHDCRMLHDLKLRTMHLFSKPHKAEIEFGALVAPNCRHVDSHFEVVDKTKREVQDISGKSLGMGKAM